MFKNYLKTALRNMMRAKTFAAINIIGFAVGLCAVIFILHYVQFHMSFDKHHEKSDRIFRVSVVSQIKGAGDDESYVFTDPIGAAMKKDFPEVQEFTTIRTERPMNLTYNNQTYKIDDVTAADQSYFSIFNVQFLTGNPSDCLSAPYQIVLNKSTAEKIFGKENPIGKVLTSGNNENFSVTGVIEDAPENSDLRFNGIFSFKSLNTMKNTYLGWNGGHQYITYVLLKNGSMKQSVESKFPAFMWEYINKYFAQVGVKYLPYLQPMNDIHLKYNFNSKSIMTNIYIFSAIAILIVGLACINFINLFMSRAIKRNKEIGVRKVLGANRKNIFIQFISEAFILILISTVMALILCAVAMPLYNRLTGQEFTFSGILDLRLIFTTLLAMLLVCFLASFYPSLILSSFQPAQIMKRSVFNRPGRFSMKGALVIFQFAISTALIICTFLISGQLNFIKEKELGFDKENQMVLTLGDAQVKQQYETIKAELLKISGVTGAAATSQIPVGNVTGNGYFPEGMKNPIMINTLDAEADFFTTYNIKLLAGRNFMGGSLADKDAYIINEALAKKMNWSNPIGKEIDRGGKHVVIGMVKDFNFASLHVNVAPLIITNVPQTGEYNFLTVKIKSADLVSVVNSIKNVYRSFSGGKALEYSFLDEALDKVYKQEEVFREIFATFSSIAIIIALLGIFGLTLFTVEQKKKEIAIRKVHGASISGIALLVSKQFAVWIILANVIAWPAAYYFMRGWLEDFAYKAGISVAYFILAAAITLAVALAIIVYHSVKAAVTNPVESLRYE